MRISALIKRTFHIIRYSPLLQNNVKKIKFLEKK